MLSTDTAHRQREGADDEKLADNQTPRGREGAAEDEPADKPGSEGAADDELGGRQPNAGNVSALH